MDSEDAEAEPPETAEEMWKRSTFYVVVDIVVNSLKNRFQKNQPLLEAFSMFCPSRFHALRDRFKMSRELRASISSFGISFSPMCVRVDFEAFE